MFTFVKPFVTVTFILFYHADGPEALKMLSLNTGKAMRIPGLNQISKSGLSSAFDPPSRNSAYSFSPGRE
jgi:hypothetical protein